VTVLINILITTHLASCGMCLWVSIDTAPFMKCKFRFSVWQR